MSIMRTYCRNFRQIREDLQEKTSPEVWVHKDEKKNSASEERQRERRPTKQRQISTYGVFSAETYIQSTNKLGNAEKEVRKHSHASVRSTHAFERLNSFIQTTRIVCIWRCPLLLWCAYPPPKFANLPRRQRKLQRWHWESSRPSKLSDDTIQRICQC